MCKCNPENDLPYCGKKDCRWPREWVLSAMAQNDIYEQEYPEELYVKEPRRHKFKGGVTNIEVADYYARRGSHWVKYLLAPGEQLGENE